MRYVLVDQVTEVVPGSYATGIKCVTLTDEVLHDHFPDHPILPGALITEGLAQLAGFLLEVSFNQGSNPTRRAVLVQIERMKFYEMTGPGEALVMKAVIEQTLTDAAQVSVEARVGEEVRAKGRITFAMMAIDSKNIANQRNDIYKIWMRKIKNPPVVR